MVKLDVGISGKTVFYNGNMFYLPAALIPFFIMFAGKTVEVRVEIGGPFLCIKTDPLVFKLVNSQFKICSDMAIQAFGKSNKYEVGKSYYLSVVESKKAKAVKTKPKRKK